MKLVENLNKLFCFLSLIFFLQSSSSFCMDHFVPSNQGVFINWDTLNSEPIVYVENPERQSYTVPMTSSFAFDKAKELLKSGVSEQTRIGVEIMVTLFTKKYTPAIELFDSICDERNPSQLSKSVDTLEKILVSHFSDKKTRLGGWEEEDE